MRPHVPALHVEHEHKARDGLAALLSGLADAAAHSLALPHVEELETLERDVLRHRRDVEGAELCPANREALLVDTVVPRGEPVLHHRLVHARHLRDRLVCERVELYALAQLEVRLEHCERVVDL
jgi:hypothetical protein